MTRSHPTLGTVRNVFLPQGSLSRSVLFLGALLLMMTFPAGGHAFDFGGTSGGPVAGSLTVTVVDAQDGSPIQGAWVMVGPEAGDPFAVNYGQTGAGGQIVFTDGSLSGPSTVTAAKDGYRVITLIDVDAAQVTLPLELFTVYAPADPPLDTGAIVQGSVTNMDDLASFVDVGIVRDPLDLNWVMDFDLNELFGPAVVETFSGQPGSFDLPRNTYIPSQTVSGTTIDRTPYMLRLPEGSSQELFCLKGQIGLVPLLDVLGSGSIGTLVGNLTYTRFGLEDPFTVSGPMTQNVNLDTVYNAFIARMVFSVSNLPSVPYGWPAGTTKRPFLLPLADIDQQDGTGRIVKFISFENHLVITVLFIGQAPKMKFAHVVHYGVMSGRALIAEQYRSGSRLIGKQLSVTQKLGIPVDFADPDAGEYTFMDFGCGGKVLDQACHHGTLFEGEFKIDIFRDVTGRTPGGPRIVGGRKCQSMDPGQGGHLSAQGGTIQKITLPGTAPAWSQGIFVHSLNTK